MASVEARCVALATLSQGLAKCERILCDLLPIAQGPATSDNVGSDIHDEVLAIVGELYELKSKARRRRQNLEGQAEVIG